MTASAHEGMGGRRSYDAAMRGSVQRLARALGLESELRRARGLVAPPAVKRNRRDESAAALVMACVLRSHDAAVDVGANVGSFLARIVHVAPDGQHVAYEPIPRLARSLEQRFPGVVVREAALSDTAGSTRFFVHRRTWASSLFPVGTDSLAEDVDVRTVRLDDDLPDDVCPRFVKIDVEGAEALVFGGAQETLAKHRPVLFFEHGDASRRNGISSADVWKLIVPHGYRILDSAGREYDLRAFEHASVWNFFAAPL